MRTIIGLLITGILAAGCNKKDPAASPVQETGYATGKVTDALGNPLAGVGVLIDNSIFFNSNLTTSTDDNGHYRIRIPNGSWYAFAQHQVNYHGKKYSFYLQPDKTDGFGGEGAVRNFRWRLTGEMPAPLAGFFGGTIIFESYPGNYIDDEQKIEFTLEPIGNLVDGSAGDILKRYSADGYRLEDVPIGRYRVAAHYQGSALSLRRWNSEDPFQLSTELFFEPRIDGQCDNCAILEYKK